MAAALGGARSTRAVDAAPKAIKAMEKCEDGCKVANPSPVDKFELWGPLLTKAISP